MTRAGVCLVAHGTVDVLDDLPEFLTNIRRGHPPTPELLHEVRRRYEAIGGRSPLNAINHELAARVSAKLGVPTRLSNRLFHPYPEEVLRAFVSDGVTELAVVPLAQHSAAIYGEAVAEAARRVPAITRVVAAKNWGRVAALSQAFAAAILDALTAVPAGEGERTAIVLTAHSLPVSVVRAGDPYEAEVRASAEDVVARVRSARPGAFSQHVVAFQSQGMSAGPRGVRIEWLGPDLRATLEHLKTLDQRHVVVAPIGFLADHVEILYDLDIEARGWAEELGLVLYRTRSLNAEGPMVDAVSTVAAPLLASLRATGAGSGG